MANQPTLKLDIRSVRRIRLAVYHESADDDRQPEWIREIRRRCRVIRECDFCEAIVTDRTDVRPDEPPLACPACQVEWRQVLFAK